MRALFALTFGFLVAYILLKVEQPHLVEAMKTWLVGKLYQWQSRFVRRGGPSRGSSAPPSDAPPAPKSRS